MGALFIINETVSAVLAPHMIRTCCTVCHGSDPKSKYLFCLTGSQTNILIYSCSSHLSIVIVVPKDLARILHQVKYLVYFTTLSKLNMENWISASDVQTRSLFNLTRQKKTNDLMLSETRVYHTVNFQTPLYFLLTWSLILSL